MTQEIAIQEQPVAVTEAQAAAWVGLATQKNETAATLTKMELKAQSILQLVKDSKDFSDIDNALAEYRKAHTAIMEARKPFTGMIDAHVIQPLMAFEKRVDPKGNEMYTTLANRSLLLRKAEADKVAIQNAKNAEITAFKSHIHNEFTRVVHEWRIHIRKEIGAFYRTCLNLQSNEGIDQAKVFLAEIKAPAVNKFNAKYLSNEELQAIYAESNKPNYASYLAELMEEMDSMFANFASDVANAEAAIKHQEEQQALTAMAEQQEMQEDIAINTLIASSETVILDTPKIKKTVQVVIIESEAWAKAVMAAFIVNLPHLGKYIRVKSWSKLSIGQMAEYLGKLATDEGVTYNNLQLEELCK